MAQLRNEENFAFQALQVAHPLFLRLRTVDEEGLIIVHGQAVIDLRRNREHQKVKLMD